jgi:hypothetical protein
MSLLRERFAELASRRLLLQLNGCFVIAFSGGWLVALLVLQLLGKLPPSPASLGSAKVLLWIIVIGTIAACAWLNALVHVRLRQK